MARYLSLLFALLLTPVAHAADGCADALDTTVRKLHSQQTLDLCALTRNKLTLVVNTASQCGYTRSSRIWRRYTRAIGNRD